MKSLLESLVSSQVNEAINEPNLKWIVEWLRKNGLFDKVFKQITALGNDRPFDKIEPGDADVFDLPKDQSAAEKAVRALCKPAATNRYLGMAFLIKDDAVFRVYTGGNTVYEIGLPAISKYRRNSGPGFFNRVIKPSVKEYIEYLTEGDKLVIYTPEAMSRLVGGALEKARLRKQSREGMPGTDDEIRQQNAKDRQKKLDALKAKRDDKFREEIKADVTWLNKWYAEHVDQLTDPEQEESTVMKIIDNIGYANRAFIDIFLAYNNVVAGKDFGMKMYLNNRNSIVGYIDTAKKLIKTLK